MNASFRSSGTLWFLLLLLHLIRLAPVVVVVVVAVVQGQVQSPKEEEEEEACAQPSSLSATTAVLDLDFGNFRDVLQGNYTLIVWYDADDDDHNLLRRQLLGALSQQLAAAVTARTTTTTTNVSLEKALVFTQVARIPVRSHAFLRHYYLLSDNDNDGDDEQQDDDEHEDWGQRHFSFPSAKVTLVTPNLQHVLCVDSNNNNEKQNWTEIILALLDKNDDDDDRDKEEKDGINNNNNNHAMTTTTHCHYHSALYRQDLQRQRYNKKRNNTKQGFNDKNLHGDTIDWRKVQEYQQNEMFLQQQRQRQKRTQDKDENKPELSSSTRRMHLEHDKNTSKSRYFTYPEQFDLEYDHDDESSSSSSSRNRTKLFLAALTDLHQQYAVYATAYEDLWDKPRRDAEDVRLNYGYRLRQLQDDMRQLWMQVKQETFVLLSDDDDDDNNSKDKTNSTFLLLEEWFTHVWLGHGKSPVTLWAHVREEIVTVHGQTNNNNTITQNQVTDETTTLQERLSQLSMVKTMRAYQTFQRRVLQEREDRVEDEVAHIRACRLFLQRFTVRLFTLLSQFHCDLTEHFLQYQRQYPEDSCNDGQAKYPFRPMGTIDMQDPTNAKRLTDYSLFERDFTLERKPVAFTNVDLTKSVNYTLDFLLKNCGFMNVTDSVRTSIPVAGTQQFNEQAPPEWGGLKNYRLPKKFMTWDRISGKSSPDGKMPDRDLTFSDFVELAKRFDHLYLHDHGLLTTCSRLFWSKSPYDPPSEQMFRIPSSIGRFDLFQRLPESSFARSWPSLFVGRKGTNSKLHIDNGATGFWMFLFSGTKRWVVYDEAERPFLYKRNHFPSYVPDVLAINGTRDPHKQQEVHEHLDTTYPLLQRAHAANGAYEYLQRPGDLVYIPPNAPHAVENLQDTIGVAFNLVPRAGIANHLFRLSTDGKSFAEVEEILLYLMSSKDNGLQPIPTRVEDPLYTSLGEYIAQS